MVAPRALAMRIACIVSDVQVVGFDNLKELDRWRSGELFVGETIRCDVEKVLHEIGGTFAALTQRMRHALEEICHEAVVPAVARVEALWPSRRSFYRAWAAEIPMAPATFLTRVRTVRAERMIRGGAATKEAAFQAGFGSVDRLRKLLRRSHGGRSGPCRERRGNRRPEE